MDSATFATRYDSIISEPRMRRLYGSSGYFNVGYWEQGTKDIVVACDRMVDEIVATVPHDAAVIIDVGCGLGAGTRRVADRFPQALVTGANLSVWQLAATRARGVDACVATDAARMGIGDGSADAVLAMESALHFDTRAAFFAEACRVLRPGGVIATADMLFRDADVIGPWLVPHGNRITTPAEYTQALRDVGFTEVTVRDITEISWRPFCAAMRKAFEGQADAVQPIEQSLAHYVLAFARRP